MLRISSFIGLAALAAASVQGRLARFLANRGVVNCETHKFAGAPMR
jgi:hypothetical protein